MQDTADGWILFVRPRLGGIFWAHVIYAAGWLVLGALSMIATPVAMLVVLLPAGWAIFAAWNLAHDVVMLRVAGDMGALGIEKRRPDSWRTFRLEHLSTIRPHATNPFLLAGLWFLQLRVAGRAYGSEYFGPLEFVSYGSKVHFGGSLPAGTARDIVDRVAAKVSDSGVAPNKRFERATQVRMT